MGRTVIKILNLELNKRFTPWLSTSLTTSPNFMNSSNPCLHTSRVRRVHTHAHTRHTQHGVHTEEGLPKQRSLPQEHFWLWLTFSSFSSLSTSAPRVSIIFSPCFSIKASNCSGVFTSWISYKENESGKQNFKITVVHVQFVAPLSLMKNKNFRPRQWIPCF